MAEVNHQLEQLARLYNAEQRAMLEVYNPLYRDGDNLLSTLAKYQLILKTAKPEETFTSANLTGLLAECWLHESLGYIVETNPDRFERRTPNVPSGYTVAQSKLGVGYIVRQNLPQRATGIDYIELDDYLLEKTDSGKEHIVFEVKTGDGKNFPGKIRDAFSASHRLAKMDTLFGSGKYAYCVFLPHSTIAQQVGIQTSTVRQAIRDGHLVMPLPAEHNALAHTARDASQGILSPEQFNKAWGREV